MADKNENTVSLWGRLGVQIDMTPEEFEILQKNDVTARDLLINLIKSDRCFLSGESYFPEGYPNEGYVENDYDFEFNIDFQPIQKEQPIVDALDVFIESEVPFRLEEILDIDAPEEVVQELIREVKAATDVMFDYEHFDIFLMDKYEELCGVDKEEIKRLQGEISFLRDEVDGLAMLDFSDDLILQKEKRIAILECKLKAEKAGVKLHLAPENIIDADHLDCFWYGGQIGAFEYKGYTISIEVHGDVRLTLLDGAYKEELLIYNNRNNTGAYKAHDNDEVLALIKNDEAFHQLCNDGRIVFSNNNWVEYLVLDAEGNQINDIAWDNVLDNNVLEAFDDPIWVKSVVDEIIEQNANKDMQKFVAINSKFIFDDEFMINDDRQSINGYLWAVDALVDRLPSSEGMENINFYVDYNVATGAVKLVASYDTVVEDGELNKELELSLSDIEKTELIDALQSYCKTRYSQTCLEFINDIRREEGLSLINSSLTDKIQEAEALKPDGKDISQEQFVKGER